MARVVTQAAFTIGGTLAQGLARIAIPILVGRFAGESVLGLVSFVLSVCVLLSMVWPAPAGTAASRYGADATGSALGALRTLRFSTTLSLAVVAVAGAIIVGSQSRSVGLAVLAGIVTATYSAYFFTRGVFIGAFQARRLAAWEIAGALVAVAGTVICLLAGAWQGALLSLAIGYLLIAIAGWPRSLGQRHPLNRSVLSFTAHNAVANASSNGLVQLAMVIVFAVTTPAQAGIFAAAFTLATPASLLGQTINQVLIPHLTEQAARERPVRRALVLADAKLTALTVVPFAAVWLISPVAVPIVYHDRFAAAVPILQLLVVAMFFFTVALYPSAALTAWGRARELVVVNVVSLVIGVAAMIVLTPLLGGVGTAVGLLIGTAVLFVITSATTLWALRRPNEVVSPSPLG